MGAPPDTATLPPHAIGRLIGIVLVASGLFLLVPVGFQTWSDLRAFTQFRETTCTIIGKRLVQDTNRTNDYSDPIDKRAVYVAPQFTMRYVVDGRQYVATGYDTSSTFTAGEARSRQILDRYELWHDYGCWYDPSEPNHAVLHRAISAPYVLAILAGLLFGIGATILRMTPRQPRMIRSLLLDSDPHLVRSLATAAIVVLAGAAAVVAVLVFVVAPRSRPTPATVDDRRDMFQSLYYARLGSVRAHLDGGVPVTAMDDHGVPLLVNVLERCSVTTTDGETFGAFAIELVQRHANVNAPSRSGVTPLMAAARACPAAVVRTLVGAGARVDDAARDGSTAMTIAAGLGRTDVVDVLRTAAPGGRPPRN